MSPQTSHNLEEPTIVHGSSESMRTLDDRTVTLTITSPPYFNAMDYTQYEGTGTSKHRSRTYANGFDSYAAYLGLMQRIFSEAYRVTVPGGHVAVVVGSIQHEGRCYPIPQDLTRRLQDIGWEFHQQIVWYKGTSVCDRAGTLIQHPYPGYFYPNCTNEVVLVFRKPGPKLYRHSDDDVKEASRVPITPLVLRDVVNDIWAIPPVPSKAVDHPCPYPAELVHRLVALYSHMSDLVLDPFSGSATTGQVACAMGRRFIGYETEQRFVDAGRDRLGEPLQLKSRNLVIKLEHIEDDPFLRTATHGSIPAIETTPELASQAKSGASSESCSE